MNVELRKSVTASMVANGKKENENPTKGLDSSNEDYNTDDNDNH